jgi:hypothetical protein
MMSSFWNHAGLQERKAVQRPIHVPTALLTNLKATFLALHYRAEALMKRIGSRLPPVTTEIPIPGVEGVPPTTDLTIRQKMGITEVEGTSSPQLTLPGKRTGGRGMTTQVIPNPATIGLNIMNKATQRQNFLSRHGMQIL